MEVFHKLKEKLMREVHELEAKGSMNREDLKLLHELTDTIKNMDKICMLEEGSEGGYSQRRGYSRDGYSMNGYSGDGSWQAEMRGSYGHGSSYANRGQHWVRGHYSRDDGMSYDGGSSMRRGGYSGDGYSQNGYSRTGYSRSSMADHLEQMMQEADSPDQREKIRRFMEQMG